jgi:predicted RNA binding protein YcfA (HicA-like mRNA interferase family)
MKIPRDIGGEALIRLLGKFGYAVTRQTGSHVRLTSSARETEHHITVPRHNPLRVGTLSGILKDVASYLEIDPQQFISDFFKK